MIGAIIFDLYETLITQSGANVPRAGALGETLGLDAIAYRNHWKQLRPSVLRGELTFPEALTQIGRALGVEIPGDRVQRACDDRVRANAAVLGNIDPELISLMRDLHTRGVRLATISNCMAEDVAAWPDCRIAPYFSAAVFSFVAGTTKPDPRIYLEAVRRLGIDPSDAVYVGDGGDDELTGAGRAGLRAAQATWFVSRDPLPGVPLVSRPSDIITLAFP